MKKTLLLLLSGLTAQLATAQQAAERGTPGNVLGQPTLELMRGDGTGVAKTTALSDTFSFVLTSQMSSTSVSNLNRDYAAPFDSGRLYGMNVEGLKGFAELYKYADVASVTPTPASTTYNILGVMTRFGGTKSANSTKTINVNVWKRDVNKNAVAGRSKFFIYGTPLTTTMATKSVPFSAITINGLQAHYFAAPLTGVNYDVYLGYSINYTWGNNGGDTIGLFSTQNAASNSYTIQQGTNDTLIHANNIVQQASGTWKSIVFDYGIGNGGEQVIYPIVRFECPSCGNLSASGITRNGMTFYGSYPNPANTFANIRLNLASAASVNVELLDATGRTVKTLNTGTLSAGEQVIRLETADLAAGTYVYAIETSNGGRIAAQLTIAK